MYSNLLGEFLGTFMLVVLGCGVVVNVCLKKTKSENSGWIVITVGWGIGVSLGGTTGYAINPARDLEPRIAHAVLPITGEKAAWTVGMPGFLY